MYMYVYIYIYIHIYIYIFFFATIVRDASRAWRGSTLSLLTRLGRFCWKTIEIGSWFSSGRRHANIRFSPGEL